MSFTEDDRPKKPVGHDIGCDISLLSADELQARIALLREEILRLEAECMRKLAGRQAAENLFRK